MKTQSIYEFTDYKLYLNTLIRGRDKNGHGSRNKLAQAIQVQTAYISQVLSGERHFNLDQGYAATRFFELNDDETEYFTLMLELARSANHETKIYFQKRLEKLQSDHFELKNQMAIKHDFSKEDHAIYYSDFIYSAIHMLITIPHFDREEKIASFLRKPKARVAEVVEFLVSKKLIQKQNGLLKANMTHVFLEKDSPFIIQHHSNFRMQAVSNIQNRGKNDLHLSMVFSLSHDDYKKIKTHLTKVISKVSTVIKKSPEEKLSVLNLDLFDV